MEINIYLESFFGYNGVVVSIEFVFNGVFIVILVEDRKIKVWSMILVIVIINYEVFVEFW